MKGLYRIAPLAVLALVLSACGSGGGSATPEGVADDVLSAVRSERFERMYRHFAPHTTTALAVDQERTKFRSETTNNWWDNNREEIAGTGERSLDPGKKLEIENEEAYFRLPPERRAALHAGWYRQAHRWERFKDRVDDLRMVRVNARHGLEGDGEGSVTYRNRFGDSLTVEVERIHGTWYVTGANLRGNDKLPTRSSSDE